MNINFDLGNESESQAVFKLILDKWDFAQPSKVSVSETEIVETQYEKRLAYELIYEVVLKITGGKKDVIFQPKEVSLAVKRSYPWIAAGTVAGQLIAGAVGHPSRKHHATQHEFYIWKGRGKYSLNITENQS
jgi:hypothetical protein